MMPSNVLSGAVAARVNALIDRYSGADICAAKLLCDIHDPLSTAYRIAAPGGVVQDVTYGQLRHESELFAAALQSLGIGVGDRVATLMGKGRDYLVSLMAIWRIGAVHVPLFTAFGPPAIAVRLLVSDARAVVCDPAQLPKLAVNEQTRAGSPRHVISTGDARPGVLSMWNLCTQREPTVVAASLGSDAPFLHVFTSGTTGNPKAVVVPLRALASFHAYAEFALDLRPDDLFWCAVDPSWAYGLYFGVLAAFTTGTPSFLLQGDFSPNTVMKVLEREKVTNFTAAPTVYRALRKASIVSDGQLSLRCASSAGEALTPEINGWAMNALGVPVFDHYGQTEAGMLINNHHSPALHRPIKLGSIGLAMPGWTATILHAERDEEIGINEIGRVAMVLAKSPLAWFAGYDADPYRSREKFAGKGRWYLTGDTGSVDGDGYFRFSARDEDVIITAGYRVSPFEVESALASHPAIEETAIIGVPDEFRGEVIEAYVVLADGFVPAPELVREIQEWVKTRYALHACPREVTFIQSIPKSQSGKIQRLALRQQWQHDQTKLTRRSRSKVGPSRRRSPLT